MAMRPSRIAPADLLDRKYANIAAVTSIVLSLLGAAALVTCMIVIEEMSGLAAAYLATWVVLLAIVIAAGAAVLRGQTWGLQFSLIYYIVVAAGSLVLAAWALMPDGAKWWPAQWVPVATVLVPVLCGAGGAAVLFVLASAAGSRLRYASIVAVTIGAAVTLVVVMNLAAQSELKPISMETSGLYGPSGRMERILRSLSTQVRLTCAYTAADKKGKKLSRKHGPRTLEFLEDLAARSDNVVVVDACSDVAKAQVIARLRGQLGDKATKHKEFLGQFVVSGGTVAEGLSKEAQQWESLSEAAYLDLWGMSIAVPRRLRELAEKAQKVRDKVDGELTGSGLPDHAALADEAKGSLEETQRDLEQIARLLRQMAEIPIKVTENHKATLKKTQDCVAAASEMARTIGTPDKPRPSNPSSVLGRFITASRETARRARLTAKALGDIGGVQNADLVRTSTVWQFQLPIDSRLVARTTVDHAYRLLAERISEMVLDAEGLIKAAKKEYQAQAIVQMRPQVVQLARSFRDAHEAAQRAAPSLMTVDEQTRKVFNQAENDLTFKALLKTVEDLLQQAKDLPKLKTSTLTTDITADNIVIIEADKKVQVVEFDAVWPVRRPSLGLAPAAAEDTEQQRAFNGNAGIGSKILSMTSKPFATVLLTYYQLPPQLQRMAQPAEIDPRELSTLRRRLTEANFLVKEWNVAEPMPKVQDDQPQTRVLLVLPPPSPAPMSMGRGQPQFGAEHVSKIRQAVDSGIHAIFLTHFFRPRRMSFFGPPTQPRYGLSEYLEEDWGIEALTGYLVVPAVPDEQPGKFRVSIPRLGYLPLNNFSDHPIGKPLQTQRVLWGVLCPIRAVDSPPKGVSIQPLLSVPAHWHDTWATPRFMALIEQFNASESNQVTPEYASGDMPAPFDVAVAAKRGTNSSATTLPGRTRPTTTQATTAGEAHQVKPARIVVLGMGRSLTDDYLAQPVRIQDLDRTIRDYDPPRANSDVVVNSVYWLIGRENYIAAGPATHFVLIGETVRIVLAIIFVAALPLAVLVAGATVMVVRRR